MQRHGNESTILKLATIVAVLAVGLLAAGCPADGGDNGDDQDTGDQKMDTGSDVEEPDTEIMDSAMDTEQDAEPDSGKDAGQDVDPDVEPDAPSGPEAPGEGDLVITEFQPDPHVTSDDMGEWFELYNPSETQTYELENCRLKDDDSDNVELTESIQVPPESWFSMARSSSPGFAPDATYPSTGFALANGGDEIILECDGTQVDRVDYNAFVPEDQYSAQLAPDALTATANDDAANWCDAPMSEAYNSDTENTDYGTPGSMNPQCAMP